MPTPNLAGDGARNGKEYMCGPWSGCEHTGTRWVVSICVHGPEARVLLRDES